MKILPIITVRKGSSLKDKNIRLYKGKPLLINAVEKTLKVYGRCVVISDDKEYGLLAESAGADVFYDDKVGDYDDVTIRFRNYCEKTGYADFIVLIQCTSPNILEQTMIDFKNKVESLSNNDVLMSCVLFETKASALFLKDVDGYLYTAIKGMPSVSKPRQLLEDVYYYNGAMTAFHASQSYKDSMFDNANLIPFMISNEEMLDIDKEEDFYDMRESRT